MINKTEQAIFEKYNPIEVVIRCPRGRSQVKKQLDLYAKAAVNLYGVISKKELVEIFNSQNNDQTDVDEIFDLLLPFVFKNEWYCFYKEYIIHYALMGKFKNVDNLLAEQGDKPRFIPEKENFLEFIDEFYDDEVQKPHWNKIRTFVNKEWFDNPLHYDFFDELRWNAKFGSNIDLMGKLLTKYEITIEEENQLREFLNLLMLASNNSRIWSNKGYAPQELFDINKAQRPVKQSPEIKVYEVPKIGPNDPCHCGSGKKYKKCCRPIERSQSAYLSKSDRELFYKTWISLLGFIKFQDKIVYNNSIPSNEIFELRELLWNNPELIDDYLSKGNFSKEEEEILKGWRSKFKKETFILVDYTPEHALVVCTNENNEDVLYGVKGITDSISAMMNNKKPIYISMVLLPFKDNIIYDTFLAENGIAFMDGARKMVQEIYERALKNGIITKFE